MFLVIFSWRPGNARSAESVLAILAPTGGEVIQSGAIYPIQWEASPEIVSVKLMYSTDDGGTWTIIGDAATGTSYDWEIPVLAGTENSCLVEIVGFDIRGRPISEKRSGFIITAQAQ